MAQPKPLGEKTLDAQALRQDRRGAEKFDQCGLGALAIYMGSAVTPRKFYVPYESVTNVFRRVAVSPGSGKGFMTPILYIVVRCDDGKEYQCSFRYIQDADKMMDRLGREHPEISLLSPSAEKEKEEKEKREEAVQSQPLSADAAHAVRVLEDAGWVLEKRPALTTALAGTARVKRTLDNIKPAYTAIAFGVLIGGLVLILAGIAVRLMGGNASIAVVLALAGAAMMFVMGNSKVLPTPKRNRKALQRDYTNAVNNMAAYLKGEKNFPLPAWYAHPYVAQRMIRIIKEHRADSVEGAMTVLKEDLKKMDNTVALTGDDYTQVVTIKPLFLVRDYA